MDCLRAIEIGDENHKVKKVQNLYDNYSYFLFEIRICHVKVKFYEQTY